jgi:hypothetical protein
LCNLNGCVAGLDDLLRNREIVPHEEIDVRCVVLREFHGWLLCVPTFHDSTLRSQPSKGPSRLQRLFVQRRLGMHLECHAGDPEKEPGRGTIPEKARAKRRRSAGDCT